MTDVQKTALKDLLHLIVDKEQAPILKELIGKLPANYQSIAQGILAVGEPLAEKAEDSAIDAI